MIARLAVGATAALLPFGAFAQCAPPTDYCNGYGAWPFTCAAAMLGKVTNGQPGMSKLSRSDSFTIQIPAVDRESCANTVRLIFDGGQETNAVWACWNLIHGSEWVAGT